MTTISNSKLGLIDENNEVEQIGLNAEREKRMLTCVAKEVWYYVNNI